MKYLLAITLAGLSFVAQPCFAQTQNTLTVNQWVQPAENGTLNGRILVPADEGTSQAVEGAHVAILGADGEVLRSPEKTNAKGEFSITGVKPGVYALTARADYVFAACAMHVLDSDLVGEREFPKVAEISAANIDYTTVKTAIVRYLPPTAKQNKASIQDVQLDALVERVCAQDTFRVAQTRGGMKGRLHPAGAQGGSLNDVQLTNVFIIKDGIEVARTTTNANGEFSINTLGAGNYSLMAVGPDGLGLIGFELVDEEDLARGGVVSTADGKQLVAQIGGCCCQELAMQVAPLPQITEVIQAPIVHEPIAQTSCGCPQQSCGCGVPVDPCGCGAQPQIVESLPLEGIPVEGIPVEGIPVEGIPLDGGFVDAGLPLDGGIPLDGGFGTPAAGGGFAPGGFSGGGGGGFGGFGGGGFGGGLGGIAGLAGIGGIIAATTSDEDAAVITVRAPASPAVPN